MLVRPSTTWKAADASPSASAPDAHAAVTSAAPPAVASDAFGCAQGDCAAGDWRFEATAEYLLWHVQRSHVPPLIGTAPPNLANVGNAPAGSIVTVFGGNHDAIDFGEQSGARIGFGYWFDSDWGVDGSYFQLERGAQHGGIASDPNGVTPIGPMFLDPSARRLTLVNFARLNVATGDVAAAANNRLWGFETNVRWRVPSVLSDRTYFFAGYRQLRYDESLGIGGDRVLLPTNTDPGAFAFSYSDDFGVHNTFYGAQVGFDSEWTCNRFFVDVKGKFALGDVREDWTQVGFNHVDPTVGAAAQPGFITPNPVGGFLVQKTNFGHFHRDRIAVVPELTLNVGYKLADHVRAFIGYDFLYVSRMTRVGEHIDRVDASQIPLLNLNPIPNARFPRSLEADGRLWTQGVDLGLEFTY
jgi:hypothetical protein